MSGRGVEDLNRTGTRLLQELKAGEGCDGALDKQNREEVAWRWGRKSR